MQQAGAQSRVPPDLELRRVGVTERDAAVTFAWAAYEESCGFKGGQEIAEAMWACLVEAIAPPRQGSGTAQSRDDDASLAYALCEHDEVLGLGLISFLGSGRDREAELYLYLVPRMRHRGVGSHFLALLEKQATGLGGTGIFFRVPPGTRAGKNLGERNGYRARALKMVKLEAEVLRP